MNSIIIVGASSGIGRCVAETYIRRGLHVGVAARRVEPLEQLRVIAPDRVVAARIDVTATDSGEQLVAMIEEMGGIDTVFCVSGVGFENPDLEPERNARIVATNCDGFTRIVDAAFRYFASSGREGQIAAISSIAGTKGLGLAAAYSASKRYQSTYLAALDQLAHIRRLPIAITDIRPGFVDTDLLDPSKSHPMMMNVGDASRKIVRAVDCRRRVAVIDWRWNVVVGLWRLIPGRLWRRLPIKH